ncbi:MAG TPA: hypothetical protein VGF45_00515 [Polyangia bacterium]
MQLRRCQSRFVVELFSLVGLVLPACALPTAYVSKAQPGASATVLARSTGRSQGGSWSGQVDLYDFERGCPGVSLRMRASGYNGTVALSPARPETFVVQAGKPILLRNSWTSTGVLYTAQCDALVVFVPVNGERYVYEYVEPSEEAGCPIRLSRIDSSTDAVGSITPVTSAVYPRVSNGFGGLEAAGLCPAAPSGGVGPTAKHAGPTSRATPVRTRPRPKYTPDESEAKAVPPATAGEIPEAPAASAGASAVHESAVLAVTTQATETGAPAPQAPVATAPASTQVQPSTAEPVPATTPAPEASPQTPPSVSPVPEPEPLPPMRFATRGLRAPVIDDTALRERTLPWVAPHFGLGFAFGGDKLVEARFTNGDTQSISAGQGASFTVGVNAVPFRFGNSGIGLGGEVGWKTVGIEANNGGIRLSRLPASAWLKGLFSVSEGWWFVASGGVHADVSPEISVSQTGGSTASETFDSAVGWLAEGGFYFQTGDHLGGGFGLRYTGLDYDFGGGTKVDADNLGLMMTLHFRP